MSDKGKHKHSTLYLGDQQIAMHTFLNHQRVKDSEKTSDPITKKLNNWEASANASHPLVTIVHFTRLDDIAPGSPMPGWWEVARGRLFFDYFFDKSGVVVAYNKVNAAQKKSPLLQPEQRGFWFQSSTAVSICWTLANGQSVGDFESFTLPLREGKLQGKRNGGESLTAKQN